MSNIADVIKVNELAEKVYLSMVSNSSSRCVAEHSFELAEEFLNQQTDRNRSGLLNKMSKLEKKQGESWVAKFNEIETLIIQAIMITNDDAIEYIKQISILN